MPVTQPISGANVGDVGSIGSPQVVNQYQGVFPSGRASTFAFGGQTSVYDPASRPEVQLILADARTPSTNFDFGGGQFLYQHTYSVDDIFGTTVVGNAAKDIRPTGFDQSGVAAPSAAYATVYDKWVLNLADEVPVPNRFHFYWGVTQNLYAHGAPTGNLFGNLDSEQPLPIWGAGFLTYSGVAPRVSQAKVLHVTKYDEFNLNLLDERIPGTNLPFGTPFTTRPLGWDSKAFGTTAVGNAAKDVRPAGWDSAFVQPPVTSPIRKGGDLNFFFDQGRGTTNAANIGFYFAGGKQVDGSGWLSQEFGTSLVYLHLQPVVVPGIAQSNAFGTAFLDHFALKIRPDGWVETGFGTPVLPAVIKSYGWDSSIFQNFTSVDNWFKYIGVYPFTGQPPVPPSPTVYNLLQFVRPNGKAHSNGFGTAHLTNWHQFVSCTGWIAPKFFGTQWVAYHTRSVGPAYLSGTQTSFGTPFAALGARDLRPTGILGTTWGVALVRDRAQNVYPTGRASTLQSGTPIVRDRAQTFYPFGADSVVIGYPVVNLYARYVNVPSTVQWPVDKDRFGYYNEVRNINRHLLVNGFVHSLFGVNAFVLNKARPIYPYGEVQTRWGGQFVSHRIRSVYPLWYTQEVFGTPYARTTKIISLDGWGWSSMKFGVTGRVWSNLQTLKPYSTYEHTEYGRAWVDQGARDLRPSSIMTQPAGDPFVAFRVRNIRPAGLLPGYVGVHKIETHQNIIRCWGYPLGYMGTADYVRNVTPEIRVFGAYAYAGGNKPRVELMKRYLHATYPQDHGFVQAPFVSYRTRTIRPPSPDYLRWGNADVRFDQSQQTPPQQLVLPDSVQAGAGVVPYWEWPDPDAPWSGQTLPLGYPWVKLNTIFATSLGLTERFGTPSTKGNVLFITPGPYSNAFGIPFLGGGTKWILPQGRGTTFTFGDTRVLGPQYIRVDAKWDVANSQWYIYDYHQYGNAGLRDWEWAPQTVGPVFGNKTEVQNQHRRIYPYGGLGYNFVPASVVGSPRITTKPQYIRPAGTSAYKRGMPEVFHEGTRDIQVYSWQDGVFGTAQLNKQDYGPKWLYVSGIAAPNVTMGRVELKNRRVYPSGWFSWLSQKGAQYVGPYLRLYPSGFDATTWGTPYIDFKHRRVYQQPVVDSREPWETSYAVRVKHQARGYFMEGKASGVQFGVPDVDDHVKVIQPAGWEEFETGFSYVPVHYPGLSKLKAQAFVTHPNTATMEFGNGTVSHA